MKLIKLPKPKKRGISPNPCICGLSLNGDYIVGFIPLKVINLCVWETSRSVISTILNKLKE